MGGGGGGVGTQINNIIIALGVLARTVPSL